VTALHQDGNGNSDAVHTSIVGYSDILQFDRCKPDVFEKIKQQLGVSGDGHDLVSACFGTLNYLNSPILSYSYDSSFVFLSIQLLVGGHGGKVAHGEGPL
jgi:hypothetical protein